MTPKNFVYISPRPIEVPLETFRTLENPEELLELPGLESEFPPFLQGQRANLIVPGTDLRMVGNIVVAANQFGIHFLAFQAEPGTTRSNSIVKV